MSKDIEYFQRADVELVDDKPFFAPVASDLLDELLCQYQAMRKRIESISELLTSETSGAIQYYLDAYSSTNSRSYMPTVSALFQVKNAVAQLNGAYWSKTMNLTDVYDSMPQKRRDEWNASIREMTTPDFEESTVRTTIEGLLSMRSQFLGERVDGIFRNLSGEHVTNCPEGFSKRMILASVLNEWNGVAQTKAGLINDLRCVIAKFMGRDEPRHNVTDGLIRNLQSRWGEWVTIDGGALRIRLYKKGTAHLEVHPDMAWRLNQILAFLYPRAIPAQFRQKPAKKEKSFAMMQRPLPFAVLAVLSGVVPFARGSLTMSIPYRFKEENKAAFEEALTILESIGGTRLESGNYEFDYDAKSVIDEIVVSGSIPDQKSHQFYPTPVSLARRAIEIADIGAGHTCLEPSAGMGGLAGLMPLAQTTCIEVSRLHCEVLTSKGFTAHNTDFIEWSKSAPKFDRIIANPPFSEGRWQAHTTAMAGLLKQDGRLVVILPSSAPNSFKVPDANMRWHGPFDNEFSGTSISVVILELTKGVI
jgi:hypothetical protein